ncbi:BZ3500_MvSof-1268-A1-R1_Chr2-1g04345 [Microbotryum saponariae]|uniref:BZ3500_MvSof-1268-A1-R1_Chr2-1g04345 protein n=1 Tax=Microbotryum saponariae TaxID=289078 RepID=A0A2X0KG28_9BASI|nr:BZ3500_MvSof-1268-A1-R1_Chr2-1g04345 [Microbotryum saponariae]SCZ91497.1 BZ3501_MvSof-1269-A2-R1_Chr2-1g04001 [Microbotryum saponariae]
MATMQRSDSLAVQEVPEQLHTASVSASRTNVADLWHVSRPTGRLGLDNLHLGLIQVVMLLVLKTVLNLIPLGSSLANSFSSEAKTDSRQVQQVQTEQGTKLKTQKKRRSRKVSSKAAAAAPADTGLYRTAWLDQIVTNFIASTEPRYLKLLPDPETPPPLPAMPLEQWDSMYKDDALQVSCHPKMKSLFAIQAKFPDVPLRKLYETLIDVQKRKEWDGMCADVGEIEMVELGGRRGSCSWIAMKGMAMIKAKDLCVVSVVNRLPAEADGKVRITCSTTSFDHPKCPPKPEYNRMKLGISGFLIEDFGEGGSQITQLTDLSGLGCEFHSLCGARRRRTFGISPLALVRCTAWIPSAVLRTVTQTMLPKSLQRMGRTAAEFDLSKSRFALEGDEWLPPLLGSADDSKPDSGSAPAGASTEADDDVDEDVDEFTDDENDDLSPVATREISTLVDQLKTLTNRLSALEGGAGADGKGSKWGGLLGVSTMHNGSGRLTVAGGAAGAAIALAALSFWNRRRR